MAVSARASNKRANVETLQTRAKHKLRNTVGDCFELERRMEDMKCGTMWSLDHVEPSKYAWCGSLSTGPAEQTSVFPMNEVELLKGSWDLVTGVIIGVTILITTYNPN